MVDDRWSELAYMGLVREPLFDALNAFIAATSERVTGSVDMKLFKGSCIPVGRSSENALYSASLVSFDSAALDQCTAEGFSKYYGLQAQLWQRIKEQRR
jgi:argininosuccinate synthase